MLYAPQRLSTSEESKRVSIPVLDIFTGSGGTRTWPRVPLTCALILHQGSILDPVTCFVLSVAFLPHVRGSRGPSARHFRHVYTVNISIFQNQVAISIARFVCTNKSPSNLIALVHCTQKFRFHVDCQRVDSSICRRRLLFPLLSGKAKLRGVTRNEQQRSA